MLRTPRAFTITTKSKDEIRLSKPKIKFPYAVCRRVGSTWEIGLYTETEKALHGPYRTSLVALTEAAGMLAVIPLNLTKNPLKKQRTAKVKHHK